MRAGGSRLIRLTASGGGRCGTGGTFRERAHSTNRSGSVDQGSVPVLGDLACDESSPTLFVSTRPNTAVGSPLNIPLSDTASIVTPAALKTDASRSRSALVSGMPVRTAAARPLPTRSGSASAGPAQIWSPRHRSCSTEHPASTIAVRDRWADSRPMVVAPPAASTADRRSPAATRSAKASRASGASKSGPDTSPPVTATVVWASTSLKPSSATMTSGAGSPWSSRRSRSLTTCSLVQPRHAQVAHHRRLLRIGLQPHQLGRDRHLISLAEAERCRATHEPHRSLRTGSTARRRAGRALPVDDGRPTDRRDVNLRRSADPAPRPTRSVSSAPVSSPPRTADLPEQELL